MKKNFLLELDYNLEYTVIPTWCNIAERKGIGDACCLKFEDQLQHLPYEIVSELKRIDSDLSNNFVNIDKTLYLQVKDNCLINFITQSVYNWVNCDQYKKDIKNLKVMEENSIEAVSFITDKMYEFLEDIQNNTKEINKKFFVKLAQRFSLDYFYFPSNALYISPIRMPDSFFLSHWTDILKFYNYRTEKIKTFPKGIKLTPHRWLSMAYTLGSTGHKRSSEMIFKLIHMNLMELNNDIPLNELINPLNLLVEGKYIGKFPLDSTDPTINEPFYGYYLGEANLVGVSRYWMSIVNGLAKIYILKEEYDKAISLYKNVFEYESNFDKIILSTNRTFEAYADLYYIYKYKLKDEKEAAIIKKKLLCNVKKFYIDNFFKFKGEMLHILKEPEMSPSIRNYEWHSEFFLMAIFILDKVYNYFENY